MDPMHRNAINLALSGVLGVQYARANDAGGVAKAGEVRVDGDPKF